MKKLFTPILIVIVIAGAAVIFISQSKEQKAPETQPAAMEGLPENSQGKKVAGYTGELLAGSTTQYLAFNKTDYERAKSDGKLILLNFYADWCPICRAEAPDVRAAFDSLSNPEVIGFQVNFKDDQTDEDEKALAQEFTVPYQHTKVILKDGQEVLKVTEQWSKQQFVDAINSSL